MILLITCTMAQARNFGISQNTFSGARKSRQDCAGTVSSLLVNTSCHPLMHSSRKASRNSTERAQKNSKAFCLSLNSALFMYRQTLFMSAAPLGLPSVVAASAQFYRAGVVPHRAWPTTFIKDGDCQALFWERGINVLAASMPAFTFMPRKSQNNPKGLGFTGSGLYGLSGVRDSQCDRFRRARSLRGPRREAALNL